MPIYTGSIPECAGDRHSACHCVLDDASVYRPTDQGKINADCCDYKSGAGLDENDSLAIQRYLTYGIRHFPCTAADLKGSMNKSVSDYRQPYGGNPGGDTADVTFSFEDTSGQNTVTVAPGAKIMVSVNIDAGENPIAAIDAQFKCSDEINVSAISDTSGIIKGGVQSNIGALFANMVNPKGLSSEVDKGKAAFQLTVTVPADTREGSYTVGFSEHCRVYKDWTTSSIYSTSFTPLTIKVAEKKPATTKPKPATEKKPATTESTPATTTEKKKETEPGNANRILNLKGSQTGLKLTLKWNRKSGASMCKIYGGYCGPKMKLLKTINLNFA